jgi:hypothetical protein
MALFEELGTDRVELDTPSGRVRFWALTPALYVSRVTGHMQDEHAEAFVEYAEERLLRTAGKLSVFHDWMGMTGYESSCRQRLTSWSLAHLDRYDEVHIAQKSKLVAMGVQVANIALGGKISVHTSLVRMEAELRRLFQPHQPATR